jgi:murein DD-endopeptidase MepM/ murein hydrolase activator NlpD
VVLTGVSALGGEVTAREVLVPSRGFAGAQVLGLRVDGIPEPVVPNALYPLREGGFVVALQEARAGVREGFVGLRVHIAHPIPGSPSGGDILIGAGGGSSGLSATPAEVLALGLGPPPSARPGYTYPLAIRGVIIGCPFALGSEDSPTRAPNNLATDNGVDIAVPVGTPVLAVADGVIGSLIGRQRSRDPRVAGLRVHLNAPDRRFYYAHLSRLYVRAGQHVRRGQRIGLSGQAKGVPHIHFAQDRGDPALTIGESAACPTYHRVREPWN